MKKLIIFTLLFSCCVILFAPPIPLKYAYLKTHYEKSVNFYEYQNKVKKILATIQYLESRGNYSVQGLSTEYGAYQFTPATWTYSCNKFVGHQLNIRIASNQDLIAELKIKDLLQRGMNVKQIASIWNCGKPTYKNKQGVNRFGVKYNVPKYVKNFMERYHKIDLKNTSIILSKTTYKRI